MKLEMTLTKSTKGTHVYGDGSPSAPVPTLYIRKDALAAVPPAKITVLITFEGANDET